MSTENSMGRTGFDRFDLDESILRGVRAAGFERPRPIQAEAIPAALNGRDVLGLAQTGTGKTAAFALPLLGRLLSHNHQNGKRGGPRALVLAPTRELARQIDAEIRQLAEFTGIRTVTIFGGVSPVNQIEKLRKRPDIVVGCPGRVLDLMGRGHLRLDAVETLVLDEADHMFDMGFLPDIRRIIAALPARRQNLLFSATMPREIRGLADELLRDPKVVELADSTPADTVEHVIYPVSHSGKRALLDQVLAREECRTAIVFTRTKHRAKRLARQLDKAGHRAVGLQGNMSQNQRDRAMRGFRSGTYDILVATDIAARGIDVSGVSHVINFDVPNTPEAYTHRIGRTGRAELEGMACTFVTADDHGWVRDTERMIGATIPRETVDGVTIAPATPPARSAGEQSRRNGSSQRKANPGGAKKRRRSRGRGRNRPEAKTRRQSSGRRGPGRSEGRASDGGSSGGSGRSQNRTFGNTRRRRRAS